MSTNTNTDYVCNMDSTPVAPTQTLDVIERSLQKTYHNSIFVKFVKAIEEYHLLEPNDKIAVCISGGKDSLLLAKLFQELKKHNKFPFELEFISMDPGFTPNNLASLKLNCQHLNIDLKIFESHIFEIVQKVASDNPCYLCSKMRRGFLYKTASSLGCNKIALAHHFNDVIETTLLNVLYGSEFKTMVPKLTSDNFDNMTLIRPLFLVKEYDIQKWKTYCGISSMDCGCVVKAKKTASKRAEMKELIASLKEINPNVDKNIFISSKNINLDAVLGYKINGEFTDYESIFSRNLNVRNKH